MGVFTFEHLMHEVRGQIRIIEYVNWMNDDTVIFAMRQAASGKQIQEFDHEGHTSLLIALRKASQIARHRNKEYDLNRKDLLNAIISKRLDHMAYELVSKRVELEREHEVFTCEHLIDEVGVQIRVIEYVNVQTRLRKKEEKGRKKEEKKKRKK